MINLFKNIYRYILGKIIWEILKRKKITATIIFPSLISVKKINDNKDTGDTKYSWDSGVFSKPDPTLTDSEYLKKISKEWDKLHGHSESTKKNEKIGTFTSQISGFNRKRGRRS